ncbi:MAG TPA: phosphatidylserine decarboxylase family protein [Candidatus Binatia bacterium]|nr:phosphatidylserine decarboxylase family protein [Candidatus Binatia bacterium]
MAIAKEGYPIIISVAVLSMVTFAAGWTATGVISLLLALAVAAFFRDPERIPPVGEGLIVAPADGKVVSVAALGERGGVEAATRISIFLSPLDVHINRTPVEGKIQQVRYQPGRFLAAYKDEASERNERNSLTLVDAQGRAVGVVQVAGVLARRIVCRVKQGDNLARGERFGLIMFGSRTDVYLPNGSRVDVVEGQRVRGGETVIGRFV